MSFGPDTVGLDVAVGVAVAVGVGVGFGFGGLRSAVAVPPPTSATTTAADDDASRRRRVIISGVRRCQRTDGDGAGVTGVDRLRKRRGALERDPLLSGSRAVMQLVVTPRL